MPMVYTQSPAPPVNDSGAVWAAARRPAAGPRGPPGGASGGGSAPGLSLAKRYTPPMSMARARFSPTGQGAASSGKRPRAPSSGKQARRGARGLTCRDIPFSVYENRRVELPIFLCFCNSSTFGFVAVDKREPKQSLLRS